MLMVQDFIKSEVKERENNPNMYKFTYSDIPVADVRQDLQIIILMLGYKSNPRSCPGESPVCFWVSEEGNLLEISCVDFNNWPIDEQDLEEVEGIENTYNLGIHKYLQYATDELYNSFVKL